jgi:hypothetical protein
MNVNKSEVEYTLKQAKKALDDRDTPVDHLRFLVNKMSYQLRLATAEPTPVQRAGWLSTIRSWLANEAM